MFESFRLPMMADPEAPSGFRVTHSTKFVLVDGKGRIRAYFSSDDPDLTEQVLEGVRRLRAEAA